MHITEQCIDTATALVGVRDEAVGDERGRYFCDL
jgi:hypothetical protein